MIPRVEPEGIVFRKPASTPDQVQGRLFGIMLELGQPYHPIVKGIERDGVLPDISRRPKC